MIIQHCNFCGHNWQDCLIGSSIGVVPKRICVKFGSEDVILKFGQPNEQILPIQTDRPE